MKALLDIVRRHKAGEALGIPSVCSAHPLVVEAALGTAVARGSFALIEATSNQVNQFGGYTGMTPRDFREFVHGIAQSLGVPVDRVLLGGDHLGPNCWQGEPAATAMDKADAMIDAYVAAGFRKIHLDCSMACAGDPRPLPDALIAERAARLCRVAERAWEQAGGEAPVYVIGTEVPVPGGATETLDTLAVTTPAAAQATLEVHRRAFAALGLEQAWSRVVGLVVQPGVEFDHHHVIDYVPAAARALSRSVESMPGIVFEAHSTDYQTGSMLRALVRDHFAILKVGPGATFALREALWALADLGSELGLPAALAFKPAVLQAMHDQPRYWSAYYTDAARREVDLQFSLSDRIRYYWADPPVQKACTALLESLRTVPLPDGLLSQYLPAAHAAIRRGTLAREPRAIVIDAVARVLRDYADACSPASADQVM